MDINKLGFAVGVLALLLAIPLAVVANLITPKFVDWYSTTSLKRVKRRLTRLRIRLAVSEELWTFSPGEWEIYKSGVLSDQLSSLATLAVLYVILAASTAVAAYYRATGAKVSLRMLPRSDLIVVMLMLVFVLLTLIFNAVSLSIAMHRYRKYFYMHTAEGRDYLRARIDFLVAVVSRYNIGS